MPPVRVNRDRIAELTAVHPRQRASRFHPDGRFTRRRSVIARRTAVVVAGLFLRLAALAQTAPEHNPDPRFHIEVEAARSPGQVPETAIRHWQEANRIAGGHCAECLERIATLSFRAGKWQAAAEAAAGFDDLSTRPADKAYAELLRGSALIHFNDDRPALLDLDQADGSFKAAFGHDPALRSALYLDGRALAALHRDAEARTAFQHYLDVAPADDRYRARAEQYLADPRLARATMAPPFAVSTFDGQRITLDSLHGRVVVLDFWATWCVPCRQLLPQLQHMAERFAAEPFTLISVSWDDDIDIWKQYTAANHMPWPQILDTSRALSTAYGVDALPHTFTIDKDGALQSEVVGFGNDDLEQRVAALLARSKATATKTAQTPTVLPPRDGTPPKPFATPSSAGPQ